MLVHEGEIARIKSQIEHAKVNGDYDHHWLIKAETALRFKNVERQRLQFELGAVGRRIKDAQMAEGERRFSDTAKRVLPREVFDKILAEMAVA
jgi:hypothetical protein